MSHERRQEPVLKPVPRPFRVARGLALVLVLLGGCEETEAPITQLDAAHAKLATTELLRLSGLGIELVTALHEGDSGSQCPVVERDGDRVELDYGGGCPPESGTTLEGLSGQISFTVAPATGWFVGSFEGVGYSGHAVRGALSGNHFYEAGLARFDVQMSEIQRMDRDDLRLDALLQIQELEDSYIINIEGGSLAGPELPDTDISFIAVTVQKGSLDSCILPNAGSVELRRSAQFGVLGLSADTVAAGRASFAIGEEEFPPLVLCP